MTGYSEKHAPGASPEKSLEERLRPFRTEGRFVTFGRYKQEDNLSREQQPVRWRVLRSDGRVSLLMSVYGLDQQPYHTSFKTVRWKTCSLRQWLNTVFLSTAFTPAERQAILLTEIDGAWEGSRAGSKPAGDDISRDKVFLLSYDETDKYLMPASGRLCPATPYAASKKVLINPEDGSCCWWLRTPSRTPRQALCVNFHGERCGINVDYIWECVRPVIRVDLAADFFMN